MNRLDEKTTERDEEGATTALGEEQEETRSKTDPALEAHAARLSERWVGLGAAFVLRTLSASWHVECQGMEIMDQFSRTRQKHILAFWHRHYIALFRLFRSRPVVAITNRSHRGHIIAQICLRSGMQVLQVEGRGTRGMVKSFLNAANQGYGLGISVDGPLGPAGQVKRAAPRLAALLQCPMLPVSVAVDNKYVCAQRWDRLEVPHPFSRICFVVGDPCWVHQQDFDPRAVSRQLKRAIDRGTKLARQRLAHR